MGWGFLAHLNPGKALTAFACWWLQIEPAAAQKLKESTPQGRLSDAQNGTVRQDDAVVKILTNSGSASAERIAFTLPPSEHEDLVQSLQPRLYEWDLDVFALAERSGGRPLYTIVMALLQDFQLLDGWKLHRQTVMRFLSAVESQYSTANPYHNNTHAADVTQTVAVILHSWPLLSQLSQLEVFSVIISAAVHDLGHPGLNNDFLINSRAPMAVTYNDRSVNENMHACRTFQLALSSEELNIFSGFTKEEFKRARQLIVAMVLSTDMAVHFELLERFNRELASKPLISQWEDRSLLLQMTVHLADLANPARPFPLAKRWAEGVVKEFLDQGDHEASLGMPISPMCNKELVSMPKAQLNFISLFLRPTLASWAGACPDFTAMASCHLDITVQQWTRLQEEGFVR